MFDEMEPLKLIQTSIRLKEEVYQIINSVSGRSFNDKLEKLVSNNKYRIAQMEQEEQALSNEILQLYQKRLQLCREIRMLQKYLGSMKKTFEKLDEIQQIFSDELELYQDNLAE